MSDIIAEMNELNKVLKLQDKVTEIISRANKISSLTGDEAVAEYNSCHAQYIEVQKQCKDKKDNERNDERWQRLGIYDDLFSSLGTLRGILEDYKLKLKNKTTQAKAEYDKLVKNNIDVDKKLEKFYWHLNKYDSVENQIFDSYKKLITLYAEEAIITTKELLSYAILECGDKTFYNEDATLLDLGKSIYYGKTEAIKDALEKEEKSRTSKDYLGLEKVTINGDIVTSVMHKPFALSEEEGKLLCSQLKEKYPFAEFKYEVCPEKDFKELLQKQNYSADFLKDLIFDKFGYYRLTIDIDLNTTFSEYMLLNKLPTLPEENLKKVEVDNIFDNLVKLEKIKVDITKSLGLDKTEDFDFYVRHYLPKDKVEECVNNDFGKDIISQKAKQQEYEKLNEQFSRLN